MDEPKYILLETFGDFWNLEVKIFNFASYRLPVPVSKKRLIYIGISFILFVWIFSFPFTKFLNHIPYLGNPLIKYTFYPFFLAKFLDTMEIDGKMPYKYVLDTFVFLISPKRYEMYKPIKRQNNQKIKLRMHYRVVQVKNDLELAFKKPKAFLIFKKGALNEPQR